MFRASLIRGFIGDKSAIASEVCSTCVEYISADDECVGRVNCDISCCVEEVVRGAREGQV